LAKDVKDGATLSTCLQGHEDDIAALSKEVGMVRGAFATVYRDGDRARGNLDAEGFGRWVKNAARGIVEKSDLGTPLMESSGTGNYLVPTEYAREIFRVAEGASELMPLVRRVPMKGRTKYLPTKGTGVAFSYVSGDTDDITESNPTLGQLTLTARSYSTYIGISEQVLEDEDSGLGAYLGAILAEAYQSKVESELLTGTGSPCTGVLADAGVNVVSMPIGSQSFDGISYDDVVALVAGLTTKGKRRGSKFIMHPTISDLVFSVKNAQGDPIFRAATDGRPATLLGWPYVFSDAMPDTGDSASGTKFIAFGNPEHLVWGSRIDLELKFFDATEYRVKNCQVFFRARFRGDFQVAHPEAFAVLKTASA